MPLALRDYWPVRKKLKAELPEAMLEAEANAPPYIFYNFQPANAFSQSQRSRTMEAFLSTSLVDWRLDTRFDVNGDRYHRTSYGTECWRPLKRLGNGTFGDVWQEHCVLGANQNTFRAVKQIRRLQAGFSTTSKRELEALVAFSNPDVPEVRD